jgi:hypothetical protein
VRRVAIFSRDKGSEQVSSCRPRPARSLVPHRRLCRRTGRCRRPNHLVRSRLGRPRSRLSQSSRPRLVGSERVIGRMRRNPSLRRGGAPCRSVRVRRFRSGCARLPSPPKLLPLLLLPVRRHSWRLRRGLVYFSGIAVAPCRWRRRRRSWTSVVVDVVRSLPPLPHASLSQGWMPPAPRRPARCISPALLRDRHPAVAVAADEAVCCNSDSLLSAAVRDAGQNALPRSPVAPSGRADRGPVGARSVCSVACAADAALRCRPPSAAPPCLPMTAFAISGGLVREIPGSGNSLAHARACCCRPGPVMHTWGRSDRRLDALPTSVWGIPTVCCRPAPRTSTKASYAGFGQTRTYRPPDFRTSFRVTAAANRKTNVRVDRRIAPRTHNLFWLEPRQTIDLPLAPVESSPRRPPGLSTRPDPIRPNPTRSLARS